MNIFKKLFKSKSNPVLEKKTSKNISFEKIHYEYESDIDSLDKKNNMEDLNLKVNYDKEFLKQQEEKKQLIEFMKTTREQPSVWLSDLLEKNKIGNQKFSDTQIRKMYFQLMQDQLNEMKNNNYEKAFTCAQMTLGLLDRFISSENQQVGSFEIRSIPAIDFFLKYSSIKGLVGQFQNIKEIIYYFPEIKLLYMEKLKESEVLLELSKQIRKIIKTNGEILQKELKKQLTNYKPNLIREVCIDMALFGLLKREKIDNTHKLNLIY